MRILNTILSSICVSLLFPFCTSNTFGQSNIEFPTSNAIWSEVYQPPFNISTVPEPIIHALFDDDTLISDVLYSKLYLLSDTIEAHKNREYIGGLRNDTESRVYYFPTWSDEEMLLYDFEVEIGDTLYNNQWFNPSGFIVVSFIDSIEVSTHFRKRIHFAPYPDEYPLSLTPWIEGIGSMRGLLFQSGDVPTNGTWGELVCFMHNNITVYHSSLYNSCYPLPLYVPEQINANRSSIDVFPNPADDNFTVRSVSSNMMILEAVVYDVNGRKVFERRKISTSQLTLSTAHFKEGIYYVGVTLDDNSHVYKSIAVIR